MLELGKKQTLRVIKQMDFGVYLAEEPTAKKEEQVLLPAKQVPQGAELGKPIEVFLYKDSSDRLIATTHQPLISLGQVALLKVKQTTRIGAFLDWGLEKDLLLPFHEQTRHVETGEDALVALYVDKSGRLAATMKLYPYLSTDSPYKKGDTVQGRVYEYAHNFGIFIAVDDKYSAMIPKKETQTRYKAGEVLKLRVTQVRDDGKLTVSAREKAYLQMEPDADKVMEEIEKRGGRLPFDDKASPELIMETFGLSKAAFKRAVGHLLKERKIRLEDGKICRN